MPGWIRARLVTILDAIRASYWFLPSLFVAGAIVLAIACTLLDARVIGEITGIEDSFLFIGKPASARAILTTIAGSMITIASLTFSITIVALTMAATSFGSRLLYNFMRDRGNQVTLGVFLGTFVYCVFVLRALDADDASPFMPHFSIFVGLLLALLAIGVLIYFIHHVAESMQANNVVAAVGREMHRVIGEFFPPLEGEGRVVSPPPPGGPAAGEGDGLEIAWRRDGLLQAIDLDQLAGVAQEHAVVLRLCCRPGDWVIEGTTLATAHPTPAVPEALTAAVRELFVLGHRRTLVQDVEFAFLQLVEIAVRALSPGINDPFTAMTCIEELGAGLAHVMRRDDLPLAHRDAAGAVRVILDQTDFDGIVSTAFNQIRQHGAADVAVMLRLLEVIGGILPLARTPEQRAVLARQAKLVFDAATTRTTADADRACLEERYRVVQEFGKPRS